MAYVGTYLALTAALVLLLYLTGHAAARRLLAIPGGVRREDAVTLRLITGAAVWVSTLFALAALQLLRPGPIYATIAAAGVWGLWSQVRPGAPGRRTDGPLETAPAREPAGTPTRSVVGEQLACSPRRAEACSTAFAADQAKRLRDPVALLLATALTIVVVALWAQALRPIVAWDADVYHLTVPRLYLEHGGFRPIAFNVYSNWPLALQLLFTLAMAVKDYILATTLHFAFGVAIAALAGAFVARATSPLWGVIAAALVFLHPVFLFEIRVAYVDVACAFFLFAAFVALHRALDDTENERRFLFAAGLACGLLAAAKLNGLFGAVSIAVVYAASRWRAGTPPSALMRPLLVLAAPVAVIGLPWIVKAWWLTGNPVYPLLYDVFGGPDWSEALGRAHRGWQRAIGMGRSPIDYLLLPVRVLFLGGEGYQRFDGRLHPLAGALLPFALHAARGDALTRRALAVAGLYFALWAATSQQMRFLIPVLPLLAIATAAAGHSLSCRWLPRPALAARALGLLLVPLVLQSSSVYIEQAPRLYAALWTRGDELRAFATDEVFTAIDERLPADAGILFVGLNRGFFCKREYLADSFFEASQIATMLHRLGDRESIRRGLADRGVMHVLVERQERGPIYPQEFLDLLAEPSSSTVYRSSDGRFTLIELAAPSSARR